MSNLKSKNIDKYGNIIYSENDIYDLLLKGADISKISVIKNEAIDNFNQLCKIYDHSENALEDYLPEDISIEEFDKKRQNEWFMPDKYKTIDVQEWLFNKCNTEEEIIRVIEEWNLFKERNMEDVLRLLIFLVDDFKERNILIGVGRGSSVSSYILFLIGIHRINSLKYNLDIKEFLK